MYVVFLDSETALLDGVISAAFLPWKIATSDRLLYRSLTLVLVSAHRHVYHLCDERWCAALAFTILCTAWKGNDLDYRSFARCYVRHTANVLATHNPLIKVLKLLIIPLQRTADLTIWA